MNRSFVIFTAVIIFSSCSNQTRENLSIYRTSVYGFEQSIAFAANSNKQILNALEDKLHNPKTAEYGLVWQPKGILIADINDKMVEYIESLAKQLKEKAGNETKDGKEILKENDKNAVSDIFIIKEKGKELQEKLNNYRQNMLAVDPEFFRAFEKTIIDVSDKNYNDGFTRNYFKNTPAIAALAVLKSFESVVKITENNFLQYCLNKTSTLDLPHDHIWPLVSQSSTNLKTGEALEITAGVGIISTIMSPSVTIEGKELHPDQNGVMIYKFNVSKKPARYTLPVLFKYVQADGTRASATKSITYNVE